MATPGSPSPAQTAQSPTGPVLPPGRLVRPCVRRRSNGGKHPQPRSATRVPIPSSSSRGGRGSSLAAPPPLDAELIRPNVYGPLCSGPYGQRRACQRRSPQHLRRRKGPTCPFPSSRWAPSLRALSQLPSATVPFGNPFSLISAQFPTTTHGLLDVTDYGGTYCNYQPLQTPSYDVFLAPYQSTPLELEEAMQGIGTMADTSSIGGLVSVSALPLPPNGYLTAVNGGGVGSRRPPDLFGDIVLPDFNLMPQLSFPSNAMLPLLQPSDAMSQLLRRSDSYPQLGSMPHPVETPDSTFSAGHIGSLRDSLSTGIASYPGFAWPASFDHADPASVSPAEVHLRRHTGFRPERHDPGPRDI